MNKQNIDLKVVLVEPSGTINLGSIARLCENFGVDDLRLVSPKCNPLDKEALRMAVHGSSVLRSASIFTTLVDAVKDCDRIVATCGRQDHGGIPLSTEEEGIRWLKQGQNEKAIAIVFGREDRGLTNNELQIAQKVITIKTQKKYRSLNLSHAVSILLHHFYCISDDRKSFRQSPFKLVSPINLKNFINDLETLLLEIGFIYEHTAESRLSKIKGLLHRAEAREEEVALLRGIIRQIRWFNKTSNHKPSTKKE